MTEIKPGPQPAAIILSVVGGLAAGQPAGKPAFLTQVVSNGVIIMNWKTFACAAVVAFGFGAAAHAADATGKITAIDAGALTVTLDDGNTYDFSTPECRDEAVCDLGNFKVGDAVTVVYAEEQGKLMGKDITSQN
jgi:Cu/Ag efflux protein CusF